MDDKEKLVKIVCEAMEDECIGHCNHPPCFHVERVVNALLENGVTVQEWVPVKDRLPEDNGKLQAFLVCRNQPSATSGKVLIQDEFFTNAFSGRDNVTHWMPLPKPPK